jgi:hypothetical protein
MESQLYNLKHNLGTHLAYIVDESGRKTAHNIAQSLINLLKIRDEKNYLDLCYNVTNQLVKRGNLKETTANTSIGVAGLFPSLKESEAAEVDEYLRAYLLPSEETSLENYLSKNLGLQSKSGYNPDNLTNSSTKSLAALLSAQSANCLEDFRFDLKKDIPSEDITHLIAEYYTKDKFAVNINGNRIIAEKGKEKLLINFTNWPNPFNQLYVSTVPISSKPEYHTSA